MLLEVFFSQKCMKYEVSLQEAGWRVSVEYSYLALSLLNKELCLGGTPWFKNFVCTVEPAGVILVGPHGCVFSQRAKDGWVCSHKIDVDAGVQLAICQNRVSIKEISKDRQINFRKMSSSESETKDMLFCIFSKSTMMAMRGTYLSKLRRCLVWGQRGISLSQNLLYQAPVGKCIPGTGRAWRFH